MSGVPVKLWVDDERVAPEDFIWAVNSQVATSDLLIAAATGEPIEEVSLDHDLGGDDTGMIVLNWMIDNGVWPKVLTIHTSNPPARKRMLAAAHAEAPDSVDIYIKTW